MNELPHPLPDSFRLDPATVERMSFLGFCETLHALAAGEMEVAPDDQSVVARSQNMRFVDPVSPELRTRMRARARRRTVSFRCH